MEQLEYETLIEVFIYLQDSVTLKEIESVRGDTILNFYDTSLVFLLDTLLPLYLYSLFFSSTIRRVRLKRD